MPGSITCQHFGQEKIKEPMAASRVALDTKLVAVWLTFR